MLHQEILKTKNFSYDENEPNDNDERVEGDNKKPVKEEDKKPSATEKPEENKPDRMPWEEGGKKPNKYTWEEYQDLNTAEQDAFSRQFPSIDEFEIWLESVKPQETETQTPVLKWDKPGKLPKDYTWKEYQALSQEDQDRFYLWFGSLEAFEAWMNAVAE